MLAPLVEVQDRLLPTDLIARYAWLFDDWSPNLGTAWSDDLAAIDTAVEEARRKAIADLLQANAQEGLIKLVRTVKYPGLVGRDAADIIHGVDEQRTLLMTTLLSATASDRIFGRSLVSRWHESLDEPWADTMLTTPISDDPKRTVAFLLGLPFARAIWNRASRFGPDIEESYWREAQPWLPRETSSDDVTYALEHLMDADRAVEALHLLGSRIDVVPGALIVSVLDAVRDALIAGVPLPSSQHFDFDLERVFERLDGAGV